MSVSKFTDDQIVIAVDRGDYCGGRVSTILHRLTFGMGNPSDRPALRRRLLKLEKEGRVHRCSRRSFANSTYWWPGPESDGTRLYPGDPVANGARNAQS